MQIANIKWYDKNGDLLSEKEVTNPADVNECTLVIGATSAIDAPVRSVEKGVFTVSERQEENEIDHITISLVKVEQKPRKLSVTERIKVAGSLLVHGRV